MYMAVIHRQTVHTTLLPLSKVEIGICRCPRCPYGSPPSLLEIYSRKLEIIIRAKSSSSKMNSFCEPIVGYFFSKKWATSVRPHWWGGGGTSTSILARIVPFCTSIPAILRRTALVSWTKEGQFFNHPSDQGIRVLANPFKWTSNGWNYQSSW